MTKRVRNSELLNKTKDLLRTRPVTLTLVKIAADTGLALQFLYDLGADRLKDPGVIKIETLFNYLSQHADITKAA